MRSLITLFFTLLFTASLWAQNTVGLLSMDPAQVSDGYTLLLPHNQTNVYLIDNCGRIVHQWNDSVYKPGNGVYLMPNGTLYRTGSRLAQSNSYIHAGGGGEVIQMKNWDDELLWEFTYNDSTVRLHHDIAIIPAADAGDTIDHILAIAWERKTAAEAIAAGRDTAEVDEGELWPEHIIEIKPIGTDSAEIVWEWHVWDHLVQEYDNSQANYGVVADNPQLIDINHATDDGKADWQHMNSIDYNAQLDQIIVSVPTFNEVWIIDHSTSTSEAASHAGGLSGRGGDLIFRWGNPAAYGQGTTADQQLFFQHDAHWIPAGRTDQGKIMIFNNRAGADFSQVNIINPSFDSYNWEYTTSNDTYLPADYDWTYRHADDSTAIYSGGLSSAQRMANGNTVVLAGRKGYIHEVTPNNDIVWEYKIPIVNGSRISQGTTLADGDNLTFRMSKYPPTYGAFTGKDLTPIEYFELNPDSSVCPFGVGINDPAKEVAFRVWPNPFQDEVTIQLTGNQTQAQVQVFNLLGQSVYKAELTEKRSIIDTHTWEAGHYIIQVNGQPGQKLILMR